MRSDTAVQDRGSGDQMTVAKMRVWGVVGTRQLAASSLPAASCLTYLAGLQQRKLGTHKAVKSITASLSKELYQEYIQAYRRRWLCSTWSRQSERTQMPSALHTKMPHKQQRADPCAGPCPEPCADGPATYKVSAVWVAQKEPCGKILKLTHSYAALS